MQGMGLGARLKWFQRDWCLARGITHVRWTFDPLRAANAVLNVGKLGVVVDTYLADYYGKMVGINAGTPSDRLMADWFLDTAHVADRAARIAPVHPEDARRVTIPNDFASMLASDPDSALSERLRVRDQIGRAFEDGYVISGFIGDQSCYVLTKRDA